MMPEDIPEFKNYPAVYAFVKDHLSMQFGDARSMMLIVVSDNGFAHGCNFAAASTLCNLISGLSVSLYKPPRVPKHRRRKNGPNRVETGYLFKRLLERFFPWEKGENRKKKSKVIYDLVRNSINHALAADYPDHRIAIRKGRPCTMAVTREGWTQDELDDIVRSANRPQYLPLPLVGSDKDWSLCVESLYWGVFQLLRRLAADVSQMQRAEKRLSKPEVVWNHRA